MITFKTAQDFEIAENLTTQRIIRALLQADARIIRGARYDYYIHTASAWVGATKHELLAAYSAATKYDSTRSIRIKIMAAILGDNKTEG